MAVPAVHENKAHPRCRDVAPQQSQRNQWCGARRVDNRHAFHWIDTSASADNVSDAPVATTVDTLQISHNGSNTGATGMVGSGRSIAIDSTSNPSPRLGTTLLAQNVPSCALAA